MVTFANNVVSNDLKFSFSEVTPKYSEYGSLADVADFYSFNLYVVNNPFWTPYIVYVIQMNDMLFLERQIRINEQCLILCHCRRFVHKWKLSV